MFFSILAAALSCTVKGAPVLDVRVNRTTASIAILVEGETWLESSEVVVGRQRASNGGLELGSIECKTGNDAIGKFEATSAMWLSGSDEVVRTTVRYYAAARVATFEQSFPRQLSVTAETNQSAVTAFPCFARTDKRCFSYQNDFPSLQSCTLRDYAETVQAGSPLVVFDAKRALVYSSLDWHKAQHMTSTADWVGAGIKATVANIPANWTQKWVVAAASATSSNPPIRRALKTWGNSILRYHRVSNQLRDNMYLDAVHSTIGFWTDNGGYYHYSTGDENLTYEQVLPEVKAYHDELGVPFGHWQFDSWFYPKDGALINTDDIEQRLPETSASEMCSAGGKKGAVVNWTALDSVFPSGMANINRALGFMPMVMHNKEFSPISAYIEHSEPPGLEWLTTGEPPYGAAVPRDPDSFFKWFFDQQKDWGLSHYEQDWTCFLYNTVSALHTNITLADDLLRAIAGALALSSRTMQLCMAYPYDILAAAALPAVTNARATHDYFHVTNHTNWAIGHAAIFYAALGILPFKDGFLSSTLTQPGGQNPGPCFVTPRTAHLNTAGPETAPDREILVATLSGAIVAVMDGIGYVNKSRVMRSCRADGLVLKPDTSLAIADWCFKNSSNPPESCYIYTTHTDLIDYARLHYVYLDDWHSFSFDMLDSPLDVAHVVYNWYSREITLIEMRDDPQKLHAIRPGYENHSYLIVSPVINGWAFIGDPEKYSAGSSKRFLSVRATADRVFVKIDGVGNETIHACAASLSTNLPFLPHGLAKLCCVMARFEKPVETQEISISKADCRSSSGLSNTSTTGTSL